jgi:hypothetical protein
MTFEGKHFTPDEWDVSPERKKLMRQLWGARVGMGVCWTAMSGLLLLGPRPWKEKIALWILGTVLMVFPWGGYRR